MSPLAGSELMRSLGLEVDGPAAWKAAAPGRGPGVFIVELSAPVDEAPVDTEALRRWLDRVPALRLDGARPTPHQLAKRLAEFWLPGEQILYVGRSRKTVASRVAAMYGTPLGDDKPNPGGHWLMALYGMSKARLWWATTDAHEEYEDELLARLASGFELDDETRQRTLGLPFANLVASDGRLKGHGLENSLRDTASGPAPKGSSATRTASRSTTPRRAPTTRRVTPVAKKEPPKAEPAMVSAAGADELRAELEHLRNVVRPAVIERVKTARELGDLRENSEYQEARREQSFNEGRIQALEALLRTAVVVEGGGSDGIVAVGSSVVVDMDGEENTWQIVGANEADPGRGRISYSSPVGQALMGRHVGDEVVAQLPRGELRLRLIEVR
jgi:transcription elongation factor GreA